MYSAGLDISVQVLLDSIVKLWLKTPLKMLASVPLIKVKKDTRPLCIFQVLNEWEILSWFHFPSFFKSILRINPHSAKR